MPKSRHPKPTTNNCTHTTLCLTPSAHAAIAGYKRPTAQQREAATIHSGHVKDSQASGVPILEAYPAPLVLPGDDLSLDPQYPPQSFREWLRDKDRNQVTPKRKTVYIVGPPRVGDGIETLEGWGRPRTAAGNKGDEEDGSGGPPQVGDVVKYLEAFYHGLPVKLLQPLELKFAAWEEEQEKVVESASGKGRKEQSASNQNRGKRIAKPEQRLKPKPRIPTFIALNTTTESIRIRTRPLRPAAPFPAQLNLNDLLDVAIALLPSDAYALLLLVEQDLYEDDDDEFVCGRAYGGSRVAVVSSARYAPQLDEQHSVDREHAWPASHCDEFVAGLCKSTSNTTTITTNTTSTNKPKTFPLRSAVSAYVSALPTTSVMPTPTPFSSLWLSRICKTASHELGHCFGIDHCVYYACIMQGSASLAEDARQPPFLCPVEERKVGWAVCEVAGGGEMGMGGKGRRRRKLEGKTGKQDDGDEKEQGREEWEGWFRVWRRERMEALKRYCAGMMSVEGEGGMAGGEGRMWRAFGSWLETVLMCEYGGL